jgi:hypothetical protein
VKLAKFLSNYSLLCGWIEQVEHPEAVRVCAIVAPILPGAAEQYPCFQVVKSSAAILEYSILVFSLDLVTFSRCLLQAEARINHSST